METTKKKGWIEKFRNLTKTQKIFFWMIIAVLFYTLAGFLAAPPLLKLLLEKKLPETLHRSVSIEKIKLNPYTLTATVENFSLQQKEADAHFIAFDRLFVNLQLSSIFKRALVIKDIHLAGPKVNVSRLNADVYSFSDLVEKPKNDTTNKEPEKPFLFSLNNIQIINGNIQFQDRPKDKTHLISALNLTIPTVSNLPTDIDTNVQPALSAQINGTSLTLGGRTKPFAESRETIMDLKFQNLSIPEYLAYIPNPTEATLQSGSVDIDTKLSYLDTADTPRLSLDGLLSLRNLTIVDLNDTSYGTFPQIDIQIAPSNLLNQEIVLASINLTKPQIDFTRTPEGKILPVSLFTQEKQQAPLEQQEPKDASQSTRFTVKEITLTEGKISFLDQKVDTFQTTLSPVDLTINNFSTIPETLAEILVNVTSETSETVTVQGKASLDPFVIDTNVSLQGLNLGKYNPYLASLLNPKISAGKINFFSDIHIEKKDQTPQINLKNMTTKLFEFTLTDDKTPLIHIPLLEISDTQVDVNKQDIRIGTLNSQATEIFLEKNTEGALNLAKLLKETTKNLPTQEAQTASEKSEEKPPWIVTLDTGKIERYNVTFTDHTSNAPTTTKVSDIFVSLNSISTVKDSKGDVSFSLKINENGMLTGKGPLGISPLSTTLAMEAKNIALRPLQNYAADHAKILINDGAVSTTGEFILSQDDEISAYFKGQTQVADLALANTEGEDLLKWKSLSLVDITFASPTQSLKIDKVNWQDLFLQVTILKDGSLNLSKVARHSGEPEEQGTEEPQKTESDQNVDEEKTSTEININTFMVSGGIINFQDRKISPSYAAILDNFSGTVTGLSSQEDSLAQIDLKGKVNQQASVAITGEINPLKKDLFADITVKFKGLDLSPTSPYTGKFISYKTDKGKLTLDLYYNINGKNIKAKNKVFLDQFTLGDFVESPSAASLPIHLAIALLKNRKGEIFLDIPVEGNLDDPKFSIGSVIFRVLFNLIAKAATSPFALLGALIPQGEDLQYVQFEAGSAEITKEAEDKLGKMATVLFERPGLKIDIRGGATKQDRTSLAQNRLEQLIKLQHPQTTQPVVLNNKKDAQKEPALPMSEEEYLVSLTKAYEAHKKQALPKEASEKIKAPDSGPQSVKTADAQPPTMEEMKQELLSQIIIEDEELRLLALRRSDNVMNFLVKTGPVEIERIFTLEPQESSKNDAEDAIPPQVNLIIK